MARRRALIVTGLVVLLSLIWWIARDPQEPAPDKSAHLASRPSNPSEPPAQETVPASSTGAAVLGSGEAITILVAGALGAQGRLWRAANATAPMLLLLPDDQTSAADWQQMVKLLQAARDFHLVAWEGPVRTGIAAEGAGELRHMVVAEAALSQMRATAGLKPAAFGLIGVGRGGTAAMLLLADRGDLKAAVAISPLPRLGPVAVADMAPLLSRRQLMIAAAKGDQVGAGVVASLDALPHARRLLTEGPGRGLDLLAGDTRLAPAINGWLYAAMGPVSP